MKVGRISGGHESPIRIDTVSAERRCDETPIFRLSFDCGHQATVRGKLIQIPKGYTPYPKSSWTGRHPDAWDGWIAAIPGAVAYCPVCADAAVKAALPPDYEEGDWWTLRGIQYDVLRPLQLPGYYIGHLDKESGLPLFVVERKKPAPWDPTIEVGDGWSLLDPHGVEVWAGYNLRPWYYATDEDTRPYVFIHSVPDTEVTDDEGN